MSILAEELLPIFKELESRSNALREIEGAMGGNYYDRFETFKWATRVLNLLRLSFGENSIHYVSFFTIYSKFDCGVSPVKNMRAIFAAAIEDHQTGLNEPLEKRIAAEHFATLLSSSKIALAEGNKDVAAVLSCAALEDTLKRYAEMNGCRVDGTEMAEVINVLKSKSLLSGATKKIVESFPSIRNAAMHADWQKITPEAVSGVIGFVEQFLIERFG